MAEHTPGMTKEQAKEQMRKFFPMLKVAGTTKENSFEKGGRICRAVPLFSSFSEFVNLILIIIFYGFSLDIIS